MKQVSLALPAFGFVVATRAALGVGAIATIPAAVAVVRGIRRATRHAAVRREKNFPAAVERDVRLIGATRFPRKGDEAF